MKDKEKKTNFISWLAIVLSIVSLLGGWGLSTIYANNKQDVNIAVMNNDIQYIKKAVDLINKKLDNHLQEGKK